MPIKRGYCSGSSKKWVCPLGDSRKRTLRAEFDRRLRLEFQGPKITSDGGLLVYRELYEVLRLMALAEEVLQHARTGKNPQHTLNALFRQAVYSRMVGYRDRGYQ